jgi:signal transduction histidine kinase
MKINLSLRWLLFTSFISLGILMIGAHTMVSREYFIRGLDAAIAKNMEEAGDTFAEVITPSDGAKGVMFSGFFIATEWEAMPDYVHQSFEQPPNEVNRLFKAHRVGNSEHHETMVFVMPYVIGKQTLFISNELEPPEAMSAVALGTMRNNTEFMIIISLALLGIVLVSAWALLKFVSRPISQLRQWTDSLDSDKIAEPVPDFSYPELNELAELIRNSLASVQSALDREKRFLGYASHELRTPISTIRNNIELQRLIQTKSQPSLAEQAIIDRIDRASLTMQHLTETLLWLNQDTDTSMQYQEKDLRELIQEVSDELAFLLLGKPVAVSLDLESFVCRFPVTPARIVISNVIRNAFQHSWEGQVLIRQHAGHIMVQNTRVKEDGVSDSQLSSGYGLGLQLTAELTNRLEWRFQKAQLDDCYRVEIDLKLDTPS